MLNRVNAPTDRGGWEPRNQVLAALPSRELLSLQPHLEVVSLARGSVLSEVDEPLRRVYFVETGVVSLMAKLENRGTIGVAAVGQEGVVGIATLLLGGDTALGLFRVLVPGSALAVEISVFRSALRQSTQLRAACEASTRGLFVQILQAVPCNKLHSLEQRCARWLLLCADRTEGNTFELAPQCLAQILGVSQSTLPSVVRKLQKAGLICSRRGAVEVADRRGLEAAACDCYRIVRGRYEGLLARAFD
jgi:CRP-like cAMP-binding protein